MEEFTDVIKRVMRQRIQEKSITRCFGCILGSEDRGDHYCTDAEDKNIDRFFHTVFDSYINNNRTQVVSRLKKALMEELFAEVLDRNEAKTKTEENVRMSNDIDGQQGVVSSTTVD